MERFPRGSIPPSAFAAVATMAPTAIAKVPAAVAASTEPPTEAVICPTKACDLSTTCPSCGQQMQPEHAHYRCGGCGYRDSCCF
ncbi:MAG TPA: hypothetical protein VMZ53_09660 [Kofleriaceae bacterium]|nr:hypothetical protein [Kofleriaceae bacterium]